MLEIVQTLSEKHVTATREMTRILARCSHCGAVSEILKQNLDRHNRENRKHCVKCVDSLDHNMTDTAFYRIWKGMRQRCQLPSSPDFSNYGGRGIKVCPAWDDFRAFYADMYEGYSDGLTIEREDVNGNYEKSNCTWITAFDQQANKRTSRKMLYLGEMLHLAEVCRRSGVGKIKLVARLDKGMSADQAVGDAITPPWPKRRTSMTSLTAGRDIAS